MLVATEAIAVSGEPPVAFLGEGPGEGDGENPRHQLSFWQSVDEAFHRCGTLPGRSVGAAYYLDRFNVGLWLDPRKTCREARRLRWHHLQLAFAVPSLEHRNQLSADITVTIVDDSVCAARRAAAVHGARGEGCCCVRQ